MNRTDTDPDDGVKQLLARIKSGEMVTPDDDRNAAAATRDGFVEQDPKGHLTLTMRGKHLVDG